MVQFVFIFRSPIWGTESSLDSGSDPFSLVFLYPKKPQNKKPIYSLKHAEHQCFQIHCLREKGGSLVILKVSKYNQTHFWYASEAEENSFLEGILQQLVL